MRTRLLLAILLLLAGARFGLEVASDLAPGYGEDFAKHWVAPRVVRLGGDPYDPAVTKQVAASLGVLDPERTYFHYLERFHYPPLDLVIFAPLSRLPLRTATMTWILFSSLLYVASIPMLLGVLGFERGSNGALLMAAAMLAFAPALGNLSLGQLDVAVFFTLVLGLALEQEGRPVAAGLAVAVAIHMKLFPAGFFLFYLLLRRWRMVASIAVWTAALAAFCVAAVGRPVCTSWLRAEFAYATLQSGWEQYLPSNLSVPAFLMKGAAFLTGGHDAAGAAIVLGRLAIAGMLAVAALSVVRARSRGRDEQLWSLGALCVATSMSSPLTFQHHLVWLAIPLGLALREGAVLTFLVPYLLVGTLDPWNQPLRDATSEMSKTWRDVLWSIAPAAIATGTLWIGAYAAWRASTPAAVPSPSARRSPPSRPSPGTPRTPS